MLSKRHQKSVSVTYGNRINTLQKRYNNGEYACKIYEMETRISTHKYTRLEAFPDQLFDDKQTTLKTEEESVKCINHVSCKSHTSNNYGNTAMNDGECN